jgi:hypothetical protein
MKKPLEGPGTAHSRNSAFLRNACRHTRGLQADDVQAAVNRALLRSQHALDLLPHGQHQAADQEQRLYARASALLPLRRALVSLRPDFARLRTL